MERRLRLHEELASLAGSSFFLYFQPPTGTHIEYPCVVYSKDSGDSLYADNRSYRYTQRYQVTVITRDPDCEFPKRLLDRFPMCRMDRQFVKDNLYHNILILYY